jgi:hypothetical protein
MHIRRATFIRRTVTTGVTTGTGGGIDETENGENGIVETTMSDARGGTAETGMTIDLRQKPLTTG